MSRDRGANFPKDAWRVNVMGMVAGGILSLKARRLWGYNIFVMWEAFLISERAEHLGWAE